MPGKGSYGHPTGEGSPSEEGREPAWLCWACKVSLQSFRRADPVFVLQSLCFLCLPCGQLMCSSRLVAAMTGNLTLQSNDPEIYCSWMTDISSLLGDSTGMSSPRLVPLSIPCLDPSRSLCPAETPAFATQSRKSGCVLWTHSGHCETEVHVSCICVRGYGCQGQQSERVGSCYCRRPPVN